MKISVIIPTYNEEKYLKECLESIKTQSLRVDEILIVDSNSTDKTHEIAKSFNARLIVIKERGISRARHIGAVESKGNILVHTSADIKADRNWIKNLVKPIIKQNAEMTYGSIYLKDPDFIESIFSIFLNNFIVPFLRIFGFVFATADNIACTKEFYFKVGGFNTNLVTGEDTDLIKRAMKAGAVVYVKDAIIYTDSRRIRKWGKLKYFMFHFKNFIQTNILGKTEKEYEPVR